MGRRTGMLERRELGDAGLTYIRERLAWGRTLSRLLLDGLDLTAGRTWTYLPPAMPEEQAKRFAMGGVTRLATGRAPEMFEHPTGGRWERVYNLVEPLVAAEVGAFLTQHDHGVAVWEDPLLDAGVPGYASIQRSRCSSWARRSTSPSATPRAARQPSPQGWG
jgi:hypothetical protein